MDREKKNSGLRSVRGFKTGPEQEEAVELQSSVFPGDLGRIWGG